jgi:hypothetical protein
MMLYPTPGLQVFASLPNMVTVRAEIFIPAGARMFAVAEDLENQWFWEILSSGTGILRGQVSPQAVGQLGVKGTVPTFAYNNAGQLMITSAGRLFLFNLTSNLLSEIDTTTGAALQGPVIQVGFTDSYFMALLTNSQKFQISDSLNGAVWDPTFIAEIEDYPDNVVSMVIDHREPWFLGQEHSEVYYDSGNPLFPYLPIPGAFIEQGCAATFAATQLDNTIFWIWQDKRGRGVGCRAVGYAPTRITTHAIELAWQSYPKISDAESYAYQEDGHSFWVVYFPSANGGAGATWVYDVATQMWHERAYGVGPFTAHRSRCYCHAFGLGLVGDWASGNIYSMSINYLTDFGNPIARLRRAPHISSEQVWLHHQTLQVDMETGLGPQPSTTTTGTNGEVTGVSVGVAGNGYIVGQQLQVSQSGASGCIVQITEVGPGLGVIGIELISPGIGYVVGGLTTTSGGSGVGAAISITSVTQTTTVTTQLTDAAGNPRGPQVYLRWSDDGGHNWSNSYARDAGQAGEFTKRVIWRRLGRSRDRVYEFLCTDPIPVRIIDSYLKATPGFTVPAERLSRQLLKVT